MEQVQNRCVDEDLVLIPGHWMFTLCVVEE